jgi:hypothetical protein
MENTHEYKNKELVGLKTTMGGPRFGLRKGNKYLEMGVVVVLISKPKIKTLPSALFLSSRQQQQLNTKNLPLVSLMELPHHSHLKILCFKHFKPRK